MLLFGITLVLALSGSNAEGEFCILHTPDSLKFKPSGATWESMVKEIFAASLGLSVPYDTEWDGLYVTNPFNTPEAAVDVHINGVSGLGAANYGSKAKIFPLLVDEYEPDTFKGVKLRIKQRFDASANVLVNFKLSEVSKFSRIKNVFGKLDALSYKRNLMSLHVYLNQGVSEDRLFLQELRTLRIVIEKVRDGVLTSDKLIDFYNFRFRSLHTLSDYYGPFSNQTKEAMKLLGDALQELSKAFVKAYDGSVLVTVIATEVSHSRRSARAVTTTPLGQTQRWPYKYMKLQQQLHQEDKPMEGQTRDRPESDVERRRDYSPGYTESLPDESSPEPTGFAADEHSETNLFIDRSEEKTQESVDPLPKYNAAIFNLFLHLGMAWFFAMLAIVYFLMEMDPGRDTIIYRMTAIRTIKKDV